MPPRAKVIAGNWKMNKTPAESRQLAAALAHGRPAGGRAQVIVAPGFAALTEVSEALAGSTICLAAQSLFFEDAGAFTGEVSGPQLRGAGCGHVLIGHSERRLAFGETPEGTHLRLLAARRAELVPIVCVGETLAERDAGQTKSVVQGQLAAALGEGSIAGGDQPLLVAYEPVWAIGTGRSADPAAAAEVHGALRALLRGAHGEAAAASTALLYGGSATPQSAAALLSTPEIDGLLVGGASLQAESFLQMVRAADQLS